MSKIKVVLLQEVLAPYRVPLFNEISKDENIELTVLVLAKYTSNKKEWKDIELNTEFEKIYLKGIHIERSKFRYFHFNIDLYYQILNINPDVIIIGGFYFASLAVILLNKFIREKIIIWSEATKYTEINITNIKKNIRKYILKNTNTSICSGSLAVEYLKELNGNKKKLNSFIAYNSVDVESLKYSLKLEANNLNKEFKNGFPKNNILFIGQLIDRKAIKETIEIFEEIDSNNNDIGLIIVGNGPMKNELEKYCEQKKLKVYFEGFISQDDIIKYFKIADLFILLSKYDCNPLVIMEALSCGLPIITSKEVGNSPEFVIDDFNGYCVERDNYQDVSDKILRIINNEDIKKKFGLNSLKLSDKVNHKATATRFIEAINYTYTN